MPPKFLCLHGFRTSGDILLLQTYALREFLDIDCVFIDAPFAAEGDPDPLVSQFFPGNDYLEWHPLQDRDKNASDDANISSATDDQNLLVSSKADQSMDYIIAKYHDLGPFDGLLGFSQGGEMATRVLHKLGRDKVKCVIIIGGVPPVDIEKKDLISHTPSLHILGANDQYFGYSERLLEMYSVSTRTALYHQEGHQVPSSSTNLYPDIKLWVNKHAETPDKNLRRPQGSHATSGGSIPAKPCCHVS